MSDIHIYTDGSYNNHKQNEIGGWGAAIYQPDGTIIKVGGEVPKYSTNNVAELYPLIFCLRLAKRNDKKYQVFSDSKYVVNSFNNWIDGYKNKSWQCSNSELWKEVYALKTKEVLKRFKLCWVKGHAGIEGNEIADEIAGIFRLKKPYTGIKKINYKYIISG